MNRAIPLPAMHTTCAPPGPAGRDAIAGAPRPRAPTRYEQPPRLLPAAEPDWRRILGAVRRRRWVVLAVTLLGTAAGVVAAAKFVGPRYLARARLWVGAAEPNPNAIRGTTPAPGAERLLGVEAWVDFVRSDAVLDTVVREVRLYLYPKTPVDGTALLGFRLKRDVLPGHYRLEVDRDGGGFTLFSAQGGVVQHGERGDSAGPALGFAWVPGAAVLTPGRRIEFTLLTPHDAAELLASQLQVTTDPEGTFVTVPLTGTDALAAIDAVQKSPELTQALKELTDKQAELRALRYTYTDQHFPLQQLADAVATLERRTIPGMLRALRNNLAAREHDLGQRVDSTVRYLSNIPPLLFEQTRLERDVQVAGQLYASLQQHYDEARVAEASALPDVRILDAPVQPY